MSTHVSVVIPTFNHGRFLAGAIQSALGQAEGDLDIIVVDDGSIDDSKAVAARFGSRVRYLRQENKGLSAARNTGITAAHGELLAFLDADDTWLPGFLAAVLDRWRVDATLGAVHTGFNCIDAEGRRLPQINVTTASADAMYDRLIDGEFFVPSSVVVRRQCFDRVGLFDESLRASEDWDMWLRVARRFRFGGIDRPLVNYRIHGSNMSGNPDHMLRYQLMVVAKHFGVADGPANGWPRERQRAYGAVYRYAAQGYYLHGDTDSSRRFLRHALEANPDLCSSVDLYYELGCADQPLGRRAVGGQVDLERNARFLEAALQEIFSDATLPARLARCRGRAIGHASLALGLLAYERRRLDLARRYVSRALTASAHTWRSPRAWSTLGKSLLGQQLLEGARACVGRGRTMRSRA